MEQTTHKFVITSNFSVDSEARTIEGLAVPFGVSAKNLRFDKGSLQFADISRVKLNLDHDASKTVGVATAFREASNGVYIKFRVARTATGEEALMNAVDGVYDGLSVEVQFGAAGDLEADPKNRGGYLVKRADLTAVALTPRPAFADARLTKVSLSDDEVMYYPVEEEDPLLFTQEIDTSKEEDHMSETNESAESAEFTRPVVNVTRPVTARQEFLNDTEAYRFDARGRFVEGPYLFSRDLREMQMAGDTTGQSDAGKRVMSVLRAKFADIDVADVNELNPNIQRPDLYVGLQSYEYPIWSAINNGAPPNGVQPFTYPKRSSSTLAVAAHTEGTEPTGGTFVSTSTTVTPVSLSGKASMTREIFDMGGNPAVSNLIVDELLRSYAEGLETAAAAALAAATTGASSWIELGSLTDGSLADAWTDELIDLGYERPYDFSVFVMEKSLYKAFATAADNSGAGRRYYPMVAPQNASGNAVAKYAQLNLDGVVGTRSWAVDALGSSAGTSFLFDPRFVHGWATAPQQLVFPGSGGGTSYQPVAFVDIAVWGYRAVHVRDTSAVRQVSYGAPLS